MIYGNDESSANTTTDHFPFVVVFTVILLFLILTNSGGGDATQIAGRGEPAKSKLDVERSRKDDDNEHDDENEKSSKTESAKEKRNENENDETQPLAFGRSKKNADTAMNEELVRLRAELRMLEHKVHLVEKLIEELTADSYPTVDQQVGMRRDIDRIFINEIPLMRQSILELNVRQVEQTKRKLRVTWLNAHDSLLNHTNDLFLPFGKSDVLCLYNARMPLNRFDERYRRPDSVDVFKPVIHYRSHYMILAVMRVDKDDAIVSGLVFSPSLNVTFPYDDTIEQDLEFVRKYIRLEKEEKRHRDGEDVNGRRVLSLRCVIDETNDCYIGMIFPQSNEYDSKSESGLLEGSIERARNDFAEQKTAGRTQSDRLNVFVMGDVGCNLETFRREVVPRLTNVSQLKSEFEYCLSAPLMTDLSADKHFRHNVHALSNNRIHHFGAYPVIKTRLAVEACFTLDRSDGVNAVGKVDANRKVSRRTLHGRSII